jgi:hypothetical protein
MNVTPADMAVLATIARYYVLTREQIQRLCSPSAASGRTTRKRLTKLRQAGYIAKHRLMVTLPELKGAAPIYYPTGEGTEALASYFDDERYLVTNTRPPRADRLAHWIAVNDTRMTIEQAVARQSEVSLEAWINEWEAINKDGAEPERYYLHVQLRENPPLSCAPDAAFLLSVRGHKKVFYVERDLGTSSPKQVAARKTKGYAELAARQHHRKHFPQTTLDRFSVLFVTTTKYRRDATAKAIAKRPRPDLWLFVDQRDVTPETFLFEPITWNHLGQAGPLVKRDKGGGTESVAAEPPTDHNEGQNSP